VRRVSVRADDRCMGEHAVTRGMLARVLGYDRAMFNWLVSLGGAHGFVRVDGPRAAGQGPSPTLQQIVDLSVAAEFFEHYGNSLQLNSSTSRPSLGKFVGFKLGVVFTTLFLFFALTTLVSFTLRETQERMLKFTFLLHHHVRHNISYFTLISSHLIDSLVYLPIMLGMLFFLIEFFDDQLLAFLVLTVVWIAEVYSVVAVRTPTSIRFFPRFFFVYFSLFSVYFFSFPFGFSYLALFVCYGLLFHAMMHLWNCFEVPALQNRTISAQQPRSPPFGNVRGIASISVHTLRSDGSSGDPEVRGLRRPPPQPEGQSESIDLVMPSEPIAGHRLPSSDHPSGPSLPVEPGSEVFDDPPDR
jgi:hypothetical protein